MVSKGFILKNPYLAIKSRDEIRKIYEKEHFRIGKDIIPFYVTANFITQNQMDNLRSKIKVMTGILDKVINSYLDKGLFEDVFNFSKKEKEAMHLERGYKTVNLLNRYDLFFYGNRFKVIEINADSPGFVAQMGMADQAYLESVFFSEFKKKRKIKKLPNMKKKLLRSIIKIYREFGGKKKKPSIALVDWHNVKTLYDQYYTQEYFQSQGYQAFVCQPTELKYEKKKLEYKGKRVDIIYRRFLTRDCLAEPKKFSQIMNALKDKKVCMINPLVSTMVGDKRFLSKLSSGKFDSILTKEEKKVVNDIIPWSKEINDDTIKEYGGKEMMKKFLLKKKNDLVIKPADEYGGKDVYIGDITAKKLWEKTIIRILKDKTWIMQELLEIPQIEVPIIDKKNEKIRFEKRYINLCPYVIDGNVSGFMTRVSSSKIINLCQGGGAIPTFIK